MAQVGVTADAAEEGSARLISEPGDVNVGQQVLFRLVVKRHLMETASLFAKPYPMPAVFDADIGDLHLQGRTDPREGIDHQADQSLVAKANQRSRVDAVQ